MSDEFAALGVRLAALRESLAAIGNEGDRAIALDALRDALDRDANRLNPSPLVAGSYAVEGTIHRGPHFEVLRLRQRDLGTLHALKTPLETRAGDPLLRRLILDEARHQAAIRDPACLALRAVFRLADGRPAILTDFVDAPTLSAVLARRRVPLDGRVRLASRLCSALGAIHAAGLVHGDLSPANILLPDEDVDRAILFDFGLTRPVGRFPACDLRTMGTPGFTPPTGAGGPASVMDDLYALGVILRMMPIGSEEQALAERLYALAADDPRHRPALADVVVALKLAKSCGPRATDEAKSDRAPATRQPRAL